MQCDSRLALVAALGALAACGGGMPQSAASGGALSGASGPPAAEPSNRYAVKVLVSDDTTLIPAPVEDKNLVNGWGIAASPTSFWWVSNNGTGTSSLYDGNGKINAGLPFVDVPSAAGEAGKPTGIVAYTGSNFIVKSGSASAPSRFIFAGEDGTIGGWAPGVPPPPPSRGAILAVDNSPSGAIYKGLAYAATPADRLYAADFHNGRVDVFDGAFKPVATAGTFTDPDLREGFAPFGIQGIGGTIYVAYAKQDAERRDEVAGKGLGAVAAFDTEGRLLRRIATGGKLNAPWGMTLAPADFGRHSNELLVGNFGDGTLVAFSLADDSKDKDHGKKGEKKGRRLKTEEGPIRIDGLWGIAFGNGGNAGPKNTLFFAAGPFEETHGVFGRIDVAPPDADDDEGDDD